MPRGGPRPGAGRPKGSGAKGKKSSAAKADTKKTKGKAKPGKVATLPPGPSPQNEVFEGEVLPAKKTPLEYMLDMMNNPKADPERRDRMAVAAAPYVHGKVGEKGKKDAKREAAASAGGGRFASAPPPPRPGRVN
jgi:phage terminase small subunit